MGVLADLLLDGDEKQFAVLYPRFKEQGERGLPPLASEIDKKPPSDAKDEAREKLAKRLSRSEKRCHLAQVVSCGKSGSPT